MQNEKKPAAAAAKFLIKPDYKSYINQKGVMFFGIPTAVICLVIYYFLKGDPMPYTGICSDLWLSVFITIFICTLTGTPGVVGDIRKGKAPFVPLTKNDHPIYKHISGRLLVQAIQFGLLSMFIFALIPGGIFSIIATMSGNPDLSFDPVTYWILKSLYSGFFVACTMKWVTYHALAMHQKTSTTLVY